MKTNNAQILVVEDEEKMRHLLSIMLTRSDYLVDLAGNGVEGLEMLEKKAYDVVISDIKMPKMDGLALLEKMEEKKIASPVIFITAFATVDSAVDAMRKGAVDYITKPFDVNRILMTVERTLKLSRIMAENRQLKKELKKSRPDEELVYVSERMEEVIDLASRVAKSEAAVLICGESGTGKELLAGYIHRFSDRNEGRFVPVNCAAISQSLVESELFGHEKGAFTGADRKAAGKFEFASGGTLFLDEIGDLPLEAQAKMLRALQEKRIQRVGKNEEIPVDVRVVCATNQNLEKLVEEGKFRKDLFFRINVFPISPPPLRDRMEDILPLAKHFLKRLGAAKFEIEKEALEILNAYDWPGNVRELANAMERSVILAREAKKITAQTLSFLKTGAVIPEKCTDFELPKTGISLDTVEMDFVKQALAQTAGNQSAAARLLGLSRAKFRVLLKQLEDDPN